MRFWLIKIRLIRMSEKSHNHKFCNFGITQGYKTYDYMTYQLYLLIMLKSYISQLWLFFLLV